MTDLPKRNQLNAGMQVEIETKERHQGTSKIVYGSIKEILTLSESHSHGIMVVLQDGKIGRVKRILESIQNFHNTKFTDLNEIKIPKIEDAHNEFKEFYQYDECINQLPESMDVKNRNRIIKEKNHAAQERVVEEVCAFGNSRGGFVYLGIKDNGVVVGLEKDMQHGGFEDYNDSFANHIINRLSEIIKDMAFIAGNLKMQFRNIDEKTICIIQILPSDRPLYMHNLKRIQFCVRGPSPRVVRLDGNERDRYLRQRFPNHN